MRRVVSVIPRPVCDASVRRDELDFVVCANTVFTMQPNNTISFRQRAISFEIPVQDQTETTRDADQRYRLNSRCRCLTAWS
jgi:hypothetical protein